jgi:hypothetical protein
MVVLPRLLAMMTIGASSLSRARFDVGETLDVEHMDLVDEKNSRNDLGFAFLLPLADFSVDLVAYFAADLSSVPGRRARGSPVCES